MGPIYLLTTLDQNYLPQLQILLTSFAINNPGESVALYLLHSGIPAEAFAGVQEQCAGYGYPFYPIYVEDGLFQNAPVTRQYPKEMYYRLLAPHLLPAQLRRVLYLDPDTLIINPIRPLWETDMQGNLFAAAAHTGKAGLVNGVNQLRLGTEREYYNSGVLLMDLDAGRQEIRPARLFQYVEQHRKELVLPDQDVLNALYSQRILPLEDVLWTPRGSRWSMAWQQRIAWLRILHCPQESPYPAIHGQGGKTPPSPLGHDPQSQPLESTIWPARIGLPALAGGTRGGLSTRRKKAAAAALPLSCCPPCPPCLCKAAAAFRGMVYGLAASGGFYRPHRPSPNAPDATRLRWGAAGGGGVSSLPACRHGPGRRSRTAGVGRGWKRSHLWHGEPGVSRWGCRQVPYLFPKQPVYPFRGLLFGPAPGRLPAAKRRR